MLQIPEKRETKVFYARGMDASLCEAFDKFVEEKGYKHKSELLSIILTEVITKGECMATTSKKTTVRKKATVRKASKKKVSSKKATTRRVARKTVKQSMVVRSVEKTSERISKLLAKNHGSTVVITCEVPAARKTAPSIKRG